MALSFGLSLISEAITAGGASLVLPFAGATALDSRITFTRASTATYVGSNGLLQTAAVNTPRLVYDPVTLAAQGLLVEEQRTNLLTYSEDFSNAAWLSTAPGTITSGIVSPTGALTASNLNGANKNIYQPVIGLSAGTQVTGSVWCKSSVSGTIAVGSANSGSPQTINVNTSWQRFFISFTTVGTNDGLALFTTGTLSSVDIYGAQLEAGAFATSYIPTTTAQATRAADVATMTGTNFSSWYNQTEGTLCVEMKLLAAPASGTYPGFAKLYADDGNKIGFYTVISGTIVQFAAASNYTSSADIQQVQSSVSSYLKVAGAYKLNDFAFSANGATAAVDTSGQIPTVSSLVLNRYDEPMNGTIKSITYYPRRLANTELQALTS